MEAAGSVFLAFVPRHDESLPDGIDGVFVGGGFPEVFGEDLAANTTLLADARSRIGAGLPTWAECGGLLWLAQRLDGRAMVGAVPTDARLGRSEEHTSELQSLMRISYAVFCLKKKK